MTPVCTSQFAIALCKDFEATLAGKWHVGLTGSCLYGREMSGPNEDIDIIIYPHVEDDGSTLGVSDIDHHPREYPGVVHYIYVGRHKETGIKVDAFFLK